jgi:hypothetical protein
MSQSKESKPDKRKKRKGGPPASRLPSQMSVASIVKRFAVCGRCSFFVAGYKLLAGEEGLETAVNNTDGHWLRLAWQSKMGELVSRSFNVRLDIDYYHYESCCPECKRPFQFRAADGKELDEPLFQIHV